MDVKHSLVTGFILLNSTGLGNLSVMMMGSWMGVLREDRVQLLQCPGLVQPGFAIDHLSGEVLR